MPEGWKRTKLGDVTEQFVDKFNVEPESVYKNLGVKWYAEGVFARDPKLGSEMKATLLYRVREGQFIYNRMFATEGSFALVTADHSDGVVSNEFPVFDVDPSRVSPKYLRLHFQQPAVWAEVAVQCVGTTKSRSRWKEQRFAEYEITLPPLETQQRIVDLIDSLEDALMAAEGVCQASQATLRGLRTSIFEAHSAAGTTQLGKVATTRLGKMLSASVEGKGEPAPYLRNADVQWGRVNFQDLKSMPFSEDDRVEFSLKKDDVLVCEGGIIGRSAVLDSDIQGVFFQKAIHRIRCGASLNPHFLQSLFAYLSETGGLDDYTGGSTIAHLTGEKLRRIPVPTVVRADQDAAVEMLSAAASAVDAAVSFVGSLRATRLELLSVLLSGEHEIPESYDIDTAVQLEPAA